MIYCAACMVGQIDANRFSLVVESQSGPSVRFRDRDKSRMCFRVTPDVLLVMAKPEPASQWIEV
jgi:hypothetical protein